MTRSELNLMAAFDRGLAWAGGGSVRYIVATLTATPVEPVVPDAPRKPLNLALVIDASGSMSGAKLDAAKRAAIGVLDRLGPQDRLTVVSFASDVRVELDGVPCNEDWRELARGRIQALETRGMTNLSGGWFAGVDRAVAVAEADPAMTPRVVILSDGLANEGIRDRSSLAEHARQLRLRGVVSSTLGIGDDYDERLLQAIAENGGGRHHDAELAAEIERVLLGEVDEAIDTALEGITLDIELAPSVRAVVLGFGAATGSAGRLSVPVGALEAGRPRPVAVRLFCPAGQPGTALALRLRAAGRCSATGVEVAAAPLVAELAFADGPSNSAQSRDAALAAVVARAWHGQILRRVAERKRSGDAVGAEAYLRDELSHFEAYARDLPGGREMIRQQRLMLDRIDRRWSERTHKEMAFFVESAKRQAVDHRGPGKLSWADHLAGQKRRPG